MESKVTNPTLVLQNLIRRDADCRCGNMRLTEFEIIAIKYLISIARSINVHCINSGCHMNEAMAIEIGSCQLEIQSG